MQKLGLKPGPLIGVILRDVEEAAALGEIATSEEALDFARDWLKTHPQDSRLYQS